MFTLSTKINHFTSVNLWYCGQYTCTSFGIFICNINMCCSWGLSSGTIHFTCAHPCTTGPHRCQLRHYLWWGIGHLFDYGQQHREIQCQDSWEWAQQDEDTCTGRSTDVTQPHIEWHLITCRYKAMYHLHLYEQYKLLLYFTLSALLSDHLIVRIILFYTVSNCAAIQVPLHSIINTTVAVHSTVVHIQCDTKYKFHDNNLSIIPECWKATGL